MKDCDVRFLSSKMLSVGGEAVELSEKNRILMVSFVTMSEVCFLI